MRRWCALALLLTACSGAAAPAEHPPQPDAGPANSFIALDHDFAPYRSWTSFHIEGGGNYPRTVYVNALPPAHATRFPMGTMIVKELMRPEDAGGLEVDAMVKRGGGYNDFDGGAPGWEFFGLSLDAGAPTIAWRGNGGSGPASSYNGSGVSCVGCHAVAAGNDFVQTPQLSLAPDGG